ncbi:MAG: ROK family protein [Azospirillaceae bacterium]|nr:ROK family protein [Azospirillaceae bacterium]
MIYCFDIGGSFISLGVASTDVASTGRVDVVGRVPTPARDHADFVAALADLIAQAPGPAGAPVALALAGSVDPATGIASCANIPCLTGRPLVADLAAALRRPVVVANDAACFVLAEATVGVARGQDVVFGIILGTGVGGGLVVDGRLVRGAGGVIGEWGHGAVLKQIAGDPPVTLARLPCGCGRAGCVDTVGGARGLERLHQALHGVQLDSHALLNAWGDGETAAVCTIQIYLDLVADPLAVVVNAIGPGLVPVGGGLSSNPALIAALDRTVRDRILRPTTGPLLVPTVLGGRAGLLGAAILGQAWLNANGGEGGTRA